MPSDKLVHLIMREEGLRLEPYRDRHNLWAAGFGHLISCPAILDALERGERVFVPLHTAYQWLQEDLESNLRYVRVHFGSLGMDEPRMEALAALSYQLGIGDLLEFHRMREALADQDYERAAVELLDSRYAEQTPARARRMAQILRDGVIPEIKA